MPETQDSPGRHGKPDIPRKAAPPANPGRRVTRPVAWAQDGGSPPLLFHKALRLTQEVRLPAERPCVGVHGSRAGNTDAPDPPSSPRSYYHGATFHMRSPAAVLSPGGLRAPTGI